MATSASDCTDQSTPPEVTIHRVTRDNARLLERVDDDVFDRAVEPVLVTDFLANPANVLFVAVAGGEVIGMVSGIAYVHPDKPLQLFVNEIGVCSRFRQRGVGRRLMEALLQQARALGCSEAWVATEVENSAARGLYRGTGAEEDSSLAVLYTYRLHD